MITTFDIHTFVVYSAILHHTFVLTASVKKPSILCYILGCYFLLS